jgi:4-diphosphocytidyl-2-C-methyl-D-erythritol kinase
MIKKESFTRITLALDILRKIQEGTFKGYHELAIIKHQIDLHDTIQIEPSIEMCLECDNPAVPLDSGNVCWKAADLIKKEFGIQDNVRIIIQKRIPVMGGLAGGSANAATVIQILNELWDLKLSRSELIRIGRQAGMDVPYYFYGQTAFDSEATGILTPIETNLQLFFILAVPDFGVSTKTAYNTLNYNMIGLQRSKTDVMRKGLEENSFEIVAESMHNDFEINVFQQFPRLKEIKDELIWAGAAGAILSGSGSTVIGIAKSQLEAESVQKHVSTKCLICKTISF